MWHCTLYCCRAGPRWQVHLHINCWSRPSSSLLNFDRSTEQINGGSTLLPTHRVLKCTKFHVFLGRAKFTGLKNRSRTAKIVLCLFYVPTRWHIIVDVARAWLKTVLQLSSKIIAVRNLRNPVNFSQPGDTKFTRKAVRTMY